MKGIAVVIPAYNEESRVVVVAHKAALHAEFVIIVDDGSRDGTWNKIKGLPRPIYPVRHRINIGKGAALTTGCAAAVRLGAEIIVMMDADGQHPPEYIPRLVAYMHEKNLDFLFTERIHGDHMPFIRRAGNYAVNAAAFHLFGLRTRDLWCGFRAMRAPCLPRVMWRARDYSGEVQMALTVSRSGILYGTYPIPTIYEAGAAKGVHILHGLKLLLQMAVWRITL
jgi:glycosyltransferase involved in cell wall biosynthesis